MAEAKKLEGNWIFTIFNIQKLFFGCIYILLYKNLVAEYCCKSFNFKNKLPTKSAIQNFKPKYYFFNQIIIKILKSNFVIIIIII